MPAVLSTSGKSANTEKVVATVKASVNALSRPRVGRLKSAPDSDITSAICKDAC